VWEAEYVPVTNPGGPLLKLAIVEVHRREYLTRAQEQLLKECGDGQ